MVITNSNSEEKNLNIRVSSDNQAIMSERILQLISLGAITSITTAIVVIRRSFIIV